MLPANSPYKQQLHPTENASVVSRPTPTLVTIQLAHISSLRFPSREIKKAALIRQCL